MEPLSLIVGPTPKRSNQKFRLPMIRKSIFLPQKLAPVKVYNLLYLLKKNKNCKSNKMHDPTRKLTYKTQTSYVKYGQSYVPDFLNIKH